MSSAGRGRGGKFQKPKRGGGKHFSRDLRPLDNEGFEKSIWADPADKSSSEDDSSSEESSSSDDGPSKPATTGSAADMTREERRAAQRAKKAAAIKRRNAPTQPGDLPPSSSEEESSSDDDADMPANPNHSAKARAQATKPVVAPDAAAAPPAKTVIKKNADTSQLSRREREALEAQQAKERYQKMHAAGKTDEARADMERLKLVREKRAEEAARKEAERAEKAEHEKSKGEQIAREERQRALAAGKLGNKKKKGTK